MKKILLPIFLALSAFSFSQTAGAGVTDIDGNNYLTVIIGTQEWMAENLKTEKYANGDLIPNITDAVQWPVLTSGAWVYYNNDSQFNNPYGKLYNWFAVSDSRNLCPSGWHVPSYNEWSILINLLDPSANGGNNYPNVAGSKMKAVGTIQSGTGLWQEPNTGASNISGFFGLPSGNRYVNGLYGNIGMWGDWWSSTPNPSSPNYTARSIELSYNTTSASNPSNPMYYGFSIRCLKPAQLDIIQLIPEPKQLHKIVDLMGREVEEMPNKVLIYMYTDGTIERKYIIE